MTSGFTMNDQYRRSDVVMQLIYVNFCVWLVSLLLGWAGLWSGLRQLLVVQSGFVPCLYQAWGLLTYMFVNERFMAMFGYAILIFWFGHLALTRLTPAQLVTLYVLGGVTGGIAFSFVSTGVYAGSVAAVTGLVTAVAVLKPDDDINLLFLGRIRLLWLSLGVIALCLLSNPSWSFAALVAGGAFGGWLFVTLLNGGKDISKPFVYIYDSIASSRKAKRKAQTEDEGEKYHYAQNVVNNSADDVAATEPHEEAQKNAAQSDEEEVERILAKIRTSGYSSLTEDEKQRIFK